MYPCIININSRVRVVTGKSGDSKITVAIMIDICMPLFIVSLINFIVTIIICIRLGVFVRDIWFMAMGYNI